MFCLPVPDFLLTERCNMACKYCFEHKLSGLDIDKDKLVKYINEKTNGSFFLFGGEPLLTIDLIIEIMEAISKTNIKSSRKEKMINSCKSVITNGTLIKANLEKIKKHGLRMQISFDGVKEAHDMNRVFRTGGKTFDIVLEAIDLCHSHGIEWSLHGVVTKKTLPFLADTTMIIMELYDKYEGVKAVIDHIGKNMYQIIFEQEYDDRDVDILLKQFQMICKRIMNHPKYNIDQKKQMLSNFLNRKGGVCAAGTTLLAIDVNFDVYPCHRLVAFEEERKKYRLGSIYNPHEFEQIPLYNSYFRQRHLVKALYSSGVNIKGNFTKNTRWMNWCPSTNLETSGSIYFQNPKYNVMHVELNRLIIALERKYGLLTEQNNEKNKNKKNKKIDVKC